MTVVSADEALTWLRESLSYLYRYDRQLLLYQVGETAATFRLGLHLARRVESACRGWDVDAEYDRQGVHGDQKRRVEGTLGGGGGRLMRPDLVVHRRGSRRDQGNLLAVEVKRRWRG